MQCGRAGPLQAPIIKQFWEGGFWDELLDHSKPAAGIFEQKFKKTR